MCFSVSASFVASWFLAAIGIATLTKTKKSSHLMVAAMPLLFAAQQTIEGLLWLSFDYKNLAHARAIFMYGFLFFAFILWPLWIPLSLWIQEHDPFRIKALYIFSIIGLITSLLLLTHLVYTGATVSVATCHIQYNLNTSALFYYLGILFYVSATIGPFFCASMKYAKIFGFVLALSYLISYYWYYQVFISVWCFFAALLSAALLIMI